MIDFKKAFNRQNHAILVTKLGDMGVPGWLLNIVVGFLTDRELVVNNKGEKSESKKMPGGGSQGTVLGMLLLKYVDDLTIAEAMKLKNVLHVDNNLCWKRPLNYHNRTEQILNHGDSKVQAQLSELVVYANTNEMKINQGKSKAMLFNTSTINNFSPELEIEGIVL